MFVRGKFVPFDPETINGEFLSLPTDDFLRLTAAMKLYQLGSEIGFRHKTYKNGIEMITDSGHGQGRCLFFVQAGACMIVLAIYKKESQSVPSRILKLVNERRRRYEEQSEE